MAEIIRAVYEHGQLRPLDPLALPDGQEIRLAILSEQEQVRSALADLLAPVHAEPADEMDDAPSVDAAGVRTREAIASHGGVDGYVMCQRIDVPAGVVLP